MATVTFIKYKRQTGGTLRSVAQYVSQAKKTVAQTGHPLASGLNCTPHLAAQEFITTRATHRKDSPVWFYHYVQSFFPGRKNHRGAGSPAGERVRGAGLAGQ